MLVTVERGSKTSTGDRGKCTGRRAAARHDAHAAPRLRDEETCKQSGGTPGKPARRRAETAGTATSTQRGNLQAPASHATHAEPGDTLLRNKETPGR